MNLTGHPELIDRLAAAHALGTLRGGARRRFEHLARLHPSVRARSLVWQERLSAITELQPQQVPDPNVWKRIELDIARERVEIASRSRPSPRRSWSAGWFWRGATLAGALASVAALGVVLRLASQLDERDHQLAQLQAQQNATSRQNAELAAQLSARAQLEYVAVLRHESLPAHIMVTFDASSNSLTLRRSGEFREAADRSLQLWALPPGQPPRSLGVLGEQDVLRLSADQTQLAGVPTLAISLEPRGGVPSEGGPTGPVIFTGPLLRTS